MNVQFLETPDACQTAAAILRARTARNLDALATLERQHQQNLVDFIRGTLTDADLDQHTAERQRLEDLSREDHTQALEAIAKRQEQLRLAEIRQSNMLASYQRRCEFAEKFDQILAGTDGCDVKMMDWLKENKPADVDSAAFWRFSTMMGEYVCLPVAKRKPFGEFCRCDSYTPAPLEH